MSQTRQDLFRDTLKSAGQSLTAGRQLVFGLLENQPPQSMRQLYERAGGKIDRSSLYRTIELFERIGIAQRVHAGWKYKLELTDLFAHHHHHISCLSCGKIFGLKEDAKIEELIQSLAATSGVTAVKHQLEIQGFCADCQANSPAPAAH